MIHRPYPQVCFGHPECSFDMPEVFVVFNHLFTVYTGIDDGMCGLNVSEGQKWLIWGYRDGNLIKTGICSRSRLFSSVRKIDLDALSLYNSGTKDKEWFSSGTKSAEGELLNQKPVGTWKYYYPNGFTEEEGYYKNGIKDGKWIKYSINYSDRISEIVSYKDGLRDGEYIRYDNISIDRPEALTNYINGKQNGLDIAYYPNGLVNWESVYADDQLEGYERGYYPNGQLKQEGNFVKGKPTGIFKAYDQEGNLVGTGIDKRPYWNDQTKKFDFKTSFLDP